MNAPHPAPFDPAVLARLAGQFFGALPGQSLPPGVQAPVGLAPPGSPLASPAGLAPALPGTPLPAGRVPGSNLLPSSPASLPSLANRAPALLPSAPAGNGVPDHALAALPAYEPRLGGALLGEPRAAPAPAPVRDGDSALDALARAPFEWPTVSIEPSAGAVRPGPGPGPAVPAHAGPAGNSGPLDVRSVRRDFPILATRVHGKPLVWLDNAATTQKPQVVIDRLSHFYRHENSNIHRAPEFDTKSSFSGISGFAPQLNQALAMRSAVFL